MQKRFLLKHVGNMGDMIFFIPPVLAALKKQHPSCHITFVTAWGYKDTRSRWGKRNQGGFCIALMMTNPHLDQLVHYHDTTLSLNAQMCEEEGQRFPTWNASYFAQQKESGNYDGVWELDFGIQIMDNPLERLFAAVGVPQDSDTAYTLYLTAHDQAVAQTVMQTVQRPRIVLLEGLEGTSTRGWDPAKVRQLEQAIRRDYGTQPLWFGGKYAPDYQGRPVSLRENIATLPLCDVAIGVMSGPLHFAAAVGLPTITLFADQPLHRAAPAYFLNHAIKNPQRWHRTLVGPDQSAYDFLKNNHPSRNLTPAEAQTQQTRGWLKPGRQSTKTGLAAISVAEVMTVLRDVLPPHLSRIKWGRDHNSKESFIHH